MEAAQQIIIILESLHAQGLLGKQGSTLTYQAVTKTKYSRDSQKHFCHWTLTPYTYRLQFSSSEQLSTRVSW